MPFDPARVKFDVSSQNLTGPALDWLEINSSHIGLFDLPEYGRALLVEMDPAVAQTITIVGVPTLEPSDANVRTLRFYATELRPLGLRRIHSVNGGTTIPAGVAIDVITR